VAGQLALWRRAGASSAEAATGADRARTATTVASGPDRGGLHLHREGEELLRSHEVAVLFDVTDRTVINWAAANKLPSIRTAGGHLRFRGEDVFALLTGRPVRSA
jgi:excisionase family DNA binding protein